MPVTFKDFATSKNLVEHKTTPGEIKALLQLTDQKIADAKRIGADKEISDITYHESVYYAAIPCSKASLLALGYRTTKETEGGHDLLFRALGFSVDFKGRYYSALSAARKTRQQTTYDAVANLDRSHINKFLELVGNLREEVEKWIRKKYPNLLKEETLPKPADAAEPEG